MIYTKTIKQIRQAIKEIDGEVTAEAVLNYIGEDNLIPRRGRTKINTVKRIFAEILRGGGSIPGYQKRIYKTKTPKEKAPAKPKPTGEKVPPARYNIYAAPAYTGEPHVYARRGAGDFLQVRSRGM